MFFSAKHFLGAGDIAQRENGRRQRFVANYGAHGIWNGHKDIITLCADGGQRYFACSIVGAVHEPPLALSFCFKEGLI